jgi:hypothetical protein
MAFSWKGFLVSLAALAPTIVAGTAALAGEASTATKVQLATDSLTLASGVSQALTNGNPEEQAIAALASQIAGATIVATSQAHAAAGLPTLHTTDAQAEQKQSQAIAALPQPAAAKQVG